MKNFYNFYFIHIDNIKPTKKENFLQEKFLKYFNLLGKNFPEYEPKEKVINKLLLKI